MGLPMSAALQNEIAKSSSVASPIVEIAQPPATPNYQVIRRNGAVTPFDSSKIAIALTKVRIPIHSGQAFRREAGHRSDLIPATIPI